MMAAALKSTARSARQMHAAAAQRGGRRTHLPTVSPFLAWGFGWYVRRYLRRHFHALRVSRQTTPELPADQAVICYMNHPGWWDPLVGYFLHGRFLDGRTAYAPIDQTALAQYPVFRKLGFYGVDSESLDGAKQFLAVTRRLLRHANTAIWITPTGKFVDVRSRSNFQPGLGHIAATASGVTLLPIAVEYTFWDERTPEALIEFGRPICVASHPTSPDRKSKDEWQTELESRLQEAQARLAAKAIARDANQFDVVLRGSAGVGGWYDLARRTRALLTGTRFNPRHGKTPNRSGH